MRENPLTAFDHPRYYRAVHVENANKSPKGDLRARRYPPNKHMMMEELREHVQNHSRSWNRISTPFVSITPDPLRAFNRAADLVFEGTSEVAIVVIDAWKLNNTIPSNCLRLRLGLLVNHLFDTEILVWGEIPNEAILGYWTRDRMDTAGLFELFPSLRSTESKRRLMT